MKSGTSVSACRLPVCQCYKSSHHCCCLPFRHVVLCERLDGKSDSRHIHTDGNGRLQVYIQDQLRPGQVLAPSRYVLTPTSSSPCSRIRWRSCSRCRAVRLRLHRLRALLLRTPSASPTSATAPQPRPARCLRCAVYRMLYMQAATEHDCPVLCRGHNIRVGGTAIQRWSSTLS